MPSLTTNALLVVSVTWRRVLPLPGMLRLEQAFPIGAGANILPGVRIGDAAIIGAGAVVTSDVPPGATPCGRARPQDPLKGYTLDITGICITRQSTMREALDLLDQSGLGVLLLVSSERELERTVTDGDLRRLLLEGALLDHSLANIPGSVRS